MIVVDTSALMAIALEEPGHADFLDRMLDSECCVGAPTAFEFHLACRRRFGAAGTELARRLLETIALRCVPWDAAHQEIALGAMIRFGGRPAQLNYGDCMAYAVAKAFDAPLLFKGEGFAHTDVASPLG